MTGMMIVPCFNSTMVRLKVRSCGVNRRFRPIAMFQFHNGSIKSPDEADVPSLLRRASVSIPQWFD